MEAVKREEGTRHLCRGLLKALIAFLSNMRYSGGHWALGIGHWALGIGLVWASVASGVYFILLRTAICKSKIFPLWPCGLVALWPSTTRTLGHSLDSQTW